MRTIYLVDTFIHAAYSGDIRILSDLLEQEPWLLNHVMEPQNTPPTTALVEALRNDQGNTALFLIDRGANIAMAFELIQEHYPDIKKAFNTHSKTPQFLLSDIKKVSEVPHPLVKRRPPSL